jgi:hypothetical protein
MMNSVSSQKTFECTVDGVAMPIRAAGVMLYRLNNGNIQYLMSDIVSHKTMLNKTMLNKISDKMSDKMSLNALSLNASSPDSSSPNASSPDSSSNNMSSPNVLAPNASSSNGSERCKLKHCRLEDIGGKTDVVDNDIFDTITREVFEETNGVIGRSILRRQLLDPRTTMVYVPASKYLICFVFANRYERRLTSARFGDEELFSASERISHNPPRPRTIKWLDAESVTKSKILNPRVGSVRRVLSWSTESIVAANPTRNVYWITKENLVTAKNEF